MSGAAGAAPPWAKRPSIAGAACGSRMPLSGSPVLATGMRISSSGTMPLHTWLGLIQKPNWRAWISVFLVLLGATATPGTPLLPKSGPPSGSFTGKAR